MATEIDIAVTTTTYNVSITAEPNEYIVNITTNSGGGGVQSVTGTTVDNTDPLNPIVEVPDLTQVLTVGDKEFKLITDADNPYTFVNSDRLTWNLLTPDVSTLYLDDELDSFPNFSSIIFYVYAEETTLFPVGTTDIRSNLGTDISTPITSVVLRKGDMCELKKSNIGIWFLQVVNYSSGGVGGTWGSITGTLSDQTDLQTALDGKVDKVAGSRLITSAESTLLGNTSGTNSGDNATNTKYEVTATIGAVISFATPQIYNSIASPSSSNLTDNLSGAQIGIVQKIYHNAGTAPTVPAGWVKRGTGSYVTSTLNIIYAEWSVGTTVEYWITQ